MKLIGWALALSVAVMTPAAATAPQVTAAAPAAATAVPVDPAASMGEQIANTAATPAPAALPTMAPTPGIGMPGGRYGIQDQVTDLGEQAKSFHNGPLLWMCALISIFVLLLLGYTMFRFRRGANPTPSRTSHHTMLEVVWTLAPVLILVAIAIPSIRLLAAQYSPPPADLSIKVVGHQWYCSYQYPDNGGFEIVSNMLKEKTDVKAGERFRTDADGPVMLATDERLVIPVNKVVKFLITSEDVIHSFAVPAFWTKMDANPGRVNETWVKVTRPGVYFGQCSELCGARHGYMPIAVEVLPQAEFDAWLAAKGGTPKGAKPATTAAVAVAPDAAAAVAAPANDTAAVAQPALNQAATAQN
ncbi:cytochrome c oxidase subunit II [Sphingomonas sp.]|uniref:cytochrome c oxidase subunit II n=1 Tax=Sphingomonas sp. TaxID=28214 RepID=UPI00286CCA04|nr:cytochrome c oxidase subunit II [Sphingomonas sp.]